MAAGGLDIGAEVLSHGVMDFILGEDGLESFDGGVTGFPILSRVGGGVIADEVDVQQPFPVGGGGDEISQSLGVAGRVVDAGEENVGDKDFVVGNGEVSIDGGQDFFDRVRPSNGHEFEPLGSEGVMERESEVDIGIVAGQAFDAGDDADSRQGETARAQGEAVGGGQEVDGGEGIVRVSQGFAHAHEDD